MTTEFITYEQALALKELGFDEPCIGWYNPQVNYKKVTTDRYWAFHLTGEWENFKPSPLYQQAFRWFREKYSFIGISTISNYSDDRYVFDIFQKGNEEIYFEGSDLSDRNNGNKEYNTYEEAESACLDKLIEIVKNKQDE